MVRAVVEIEALVTVVCPGTRLGSSKSRSIPYTIKTSLSSGLSWRSTLAVVNVLGPDSTTEAPMVIMLDVSFNPLGMMGCPIR